MLTESQAMHFGAMNAELNATLRIKSDAFWIRVTLFTDLGLAEAFMFGEGAHNHGLVATSP